MPASNVFGHFDPTSLIAGDFPLEDIGVALPAGLNVAGAPLQAGTLLGLQTPSNFSATAAAKVGGNTGNGTIAMGTPATLANVQPGAYRVVFTSATAFQVYDPKGDEIGTGANGTAFGTQIKFTTTAGGTAFVAGDEFDVTITQGQLTLFSASSAANSSNAGNGALTLASPPYGNGAQVGVYIVIVQVVDYYPVNGVPQLYDPGNFVVIDPTGQTIGNGTFGTPFSNQVSFTLAQGGTPYASGDSFTLTVTQISPFWIPCVKTATDGSQVPRAVLVEEADTSSGSAQARAYVSGEFCYEKMTIDPSWTSISDLKLAIRNSGNESLFVHMLGAA